VQAFEELKSEKKPHVTVISTTRISNGPRDVPLLIWLLYHGLLATPHKDKKIMESIIIGAAVAEGEKGNGVFSNYTIVRPSMLIDGKGSDRAGVRVGREKEPAVG
jgi:hypothetical protein